MKKFLINKYNLIVLIYSILSTAIFGWVSKDFTGGPLSISVCFCILVISLLIFKNKFLAKPSKILALILNLIISYFLSSYLTDFIKVFNVDATDIQLKKLFGADYLIAVYLVSIVLRIVILFVSKIRTKGKKLILPLMAGLTFSSMFFLFIPSEVMLGNLDDYMISYNEFVKSCLVLTLVSSLLILIICALGDDRISEFITSLITGLTLAMYIQNYFLNKHVGIMNGGSFSWKDHIALTIVNGLIWLLLLSLPFVLGTFFKKYYQNAVGFVLVLLFVMQGSSYVSHLLTAPKEAFTMKNYYFDNSDQYLVGSENNVIFFVLDAVDNSYIKTLREEKSDIFDEFNDFTLYTNTCSVFDETFNSMPQMLSGSSFDSLDVDYKEFYKRMKDAGFIINAYNYECGTSFNDVKEYFDNCVMVDADEVNYTVYHQGIVYNNLMMTLYQTLPYALKGNVNIKNINFSNQVTYEGQGELAYYENNDFEENMNLHVGDNKNMFIIQHIDGAHIPKDDYIATTEYVLSIVDEYDEYLKEQGLYDDALIIVTADHGLHDDEEELFQTAATPMLMVKAPKEKHNEIEVSSAPVYHTDFLKTILVCEGLYKDEDGDRFGKSIFDIKEGDIRERIWYNREFQTYYGYYYEYRYTGDTDTLEDMVNNGRYKKVY